MAPELIDLEKRFNAAKTRYGMTTRKRPPRDFAAALRLTAIKLAASIDRAQYAIDGLARALDRFPAPDADLKITDAPSKDLT